MAALWRRKGIALLLTVAVALGAAVSVILRGLAVRLETALEDTLKNTVISCTVTDPRGMGQENLGMLSAFVDMLTGKRHERGCYLDEYVRNVRAKASFPLKSPEDYTLVGILGLDSDPDLEGKPDVTVTFAPGWDASALAGAERVCLIPAGMVCERDADGPYVRVEMHQASFTLRVIGTVHGGPSDRIYCPLYAQWEDGISHAFLVERCTFDIRDNHRLEESKEALFQEFVVPSVRNKVDGLTFGVLVHDEIYQNTLEELQANLNILRLLPPVLMALCGCIGCFGSFLATRGRIREFAVMRCLGMKRRKIFLLVFAEQLILTMIGGLLGFAIGILVNRGTSPGAAVRAAMVMCLYLLGAILAAWKVSNINVIKLMKTEE